MPRLLALVTVVFLAPVTAAADDPVSAGTPPDPTTLVKRLGSPSFAARDAAEKQLTAAGAAAVPALSAGAASQDAEVARRCTAILARLRATKAREFLAGRGEHGSPAWPRFKRLAGDSPDARALFAEMTAADRRAAAVEKAEANPGQAYEVYAAALKSASEAVAKAGAAFAGRPISPELGKEAQAAFRAAVPAAEVATLLFLGSYPLPAGVAEAGSTRGLFAAGFADGAEGERKAPFRKLFAAWLDARRDPIVVNAGLTVALFCGVPEAVPVARRVAADQSSSPVHLGQALLVLGNHGGREDIRLMDDRKRDDRPTEGVSVPAGAAPPAPNAEVAVNRTRVRDVAAAMALQLSGQDFEKYGFEADEWLTWTLRPGVAPFRAVGGRFATTEAREDAQKKAWAWLDRQKK